MRRRILLCFELLALLALVLVTRCADYREVSVDGQINFVDADCYARMTRARLCYSHPGTIIRWHGFENFPVGTSPHTTAPLDYLIVGLALLFAPFTSSNLDLAGAIISPLLAVALAGFLWWWTLRMRVRFRLASLVLYAASPLLAQGTALGRPDHQSLLIALLAVAICAEWTLARENSTAWSIASGAAWGFALWVSLYEPLVLLLPILMTRPRELVSRGRRSGWITLATILVIAFAIERRVPVLPNWQFTTALRDWSRGIGELVHVPLVSGVWFEWCSWLLLLLPLFLLPKTARTIPAFVLVLLILTFSLTLWQARWGYFFVLMFVFVAPELLAALRNPLVAVIAFVLALTPMARAWSSRFSGTQVVSQVENNREAAELRAIATQLDGPFLGPWWLSPALSYWSHQPGAAGSSHESIAGIWDSARFFAATESVEAKEICTRRKVSWVISYDADRLAVTSGEILHQPVEPNALCYVLDRNASRAPKFLHFVGQTARFKLYRIANP